jgi:hypothetical protein
MISHDQMIVRIYIHRLEGASGSAWSLLATSWLVPWRGSGYAGASRGIPLGISVTDLEIEEAIREAWAVLSAASPSARRLAAALLAMTGGTLAHPYWVTPDDLWRDRLAVLADQGAWLASWGPRPGEPACRVPPALLPESQTRRENAYALWRSTVPTSPDVTSESNAARKPQSRSRRRDDAEQAGPVRPRTRRGKSRAPDLKPNDQQD